MAESYQDAVRCVKDHYNRTRLIHCEHVRSIVQAPPMNADNGKEIRRLYDLWNQHVRVIKAFNVYNINAFLTAIMERKLGEATKLKWMEHSDESKTTSPYTDLLRFMDLQAQQFASAQFEQKQQTATNKSCVAVEEGCIVCGKGNHLLSSCVKFQSATREERWDIVMNDVRCKNCLKIKHIAGKSRPPPMCKKCHKHHYTLLHNETDTKTEEKKKPIGTTYAAS